MCYTQLTVHKANRPVVGVVGGAENASPNNMGKSNRMTHIFIEQTIRVWSNYCGYMPFVSENKSSIYLYWNIKIVVCCSVCSFNTSLLNLLFATVEAKIGICRHVAEFARLQMHTHRWTDLLWLFIRGVLFNCSLLNVWVWEFLIRFISIFTAKSNWATQ